MQFTKLLLRNMGMACRLCGEEPIQTIGSDAWGFKTQVSEDDFILSTLLHGGALHPGGFCPECADTLAGGPYLGSSIVIRHRWNPGTPGQTELVVETLGEQQFYMGAKCEEQARVAAAKRFYTTFQKERRDSPFKAAIVPPSDPHGPN